MPRWVWRSGTERWVWPLGARFVVKVPRHQRRQFWETNACEMAFWLRVRETPDRVHFAAVVGMLPGGWLLQERVAWTYRERGVSDSRDLPEILLAVRDRWAIPNLLPENVGMGRDGNPKWIDYQDGRPWRVLAMVAAREPGGGEGGA